MATQLQDLMGSVVFESGARLDNQMALRLLSESVPTFNTMAPVELTLSVGAGAEHAWVLNRPITWVERRALVLLAILLWLDGSARSASFDAIRHSNPAGSTKLDGMEFAISKRGRELRDAEAGELAKLLTSLSMDGALAGGGHSELGETLDITGGGQGGGQYPSTWNMYTRWGP